jgi:hypothetical protein
MHPGMFLLSILIGRKTFAAKFPFASDFVAEDWWENDGTASTVSQVVVSTPYSSIESHRCFI